MSAQRSLGVVVALLVLAGGCLKQPKIDPGSLKCKTDDNCLSGYKCFGATATALGVCARSAPDAAVTDALAGELGGAIDGASVDGVVGEVGGAIDGVASANEDSAIPDDAGDDGAPAVDDAAKDASAGPDTSSDVPVTGNGGASGGGGIVGGGGTVGSGGTSGVVSGSGGAGGTSAAASSGGSGGVSPAGGTVGSGGVVAAGGAVSSGGIVGAGGVTSTGGTTPIVDCGPLSKSDNGGVTYSATTVGSTAEYTCSPGYGPSGSSTRYCLATGSWSGVAPSCVPANCPGLPSPPNGLVNAPTLTYNSIATYSCSSGYEMVGAGTRTCQADGTWSGSAPSCPPVDCGALADPTNGKVTATATTYNSSATYSCNSGYGLSDSTPRTCQANKQWSGTAPTCPPVDCGALTPPANGKVNVTTTTYNSSATYTCDSGYNLSDTTPRTCQANSQWSGTAPTCVLVPVYGAVCSTAADCPSDAACCNGSVESCDATRLPSGDGTNTGEFVVSSDGLTVTDTITGLVWQRDGSGTRAGCSGTSGLTCTWAEAQAYCASLTLGSLTGWRSPARAELLTIVDFTKVNPAIDPTAFPSTPVEMFWSSSPNAGPSGGMWSVRFYDGDSVSYGVGSFYRVRCVR